MAQPETKTDAEFISASVEVTPYTPEELRAALDIVCSDPDMYFACITSLLDGEAANRKCSVYTVIDDIRDAYCDMDIPDEPGHYFNGAEGDPDDAVDFYVKGLIEHSEIKKTEPAK